jgi:alpha-beta hydrolase superfamily lysophospholipase
MTEIQDIEIIEKHPEGEQQTTPILFVHGAWHGAWCWEEFFLPYFSSKGYHVKALSLRGHGNSAGGERLRTTRVSEYVEDVANAVNSFSSPPILVGHSMGGLIVQKYLESNSIPAIPRAILLAPVPPHGVWKTTLGILMRHPLVFLQVNLTMKLFPIVSTLARTQESFFSPDMPKDQLEKYFSEMQNESFLAFMDMLFLDLPRPKRIKTPMTVLCAENDTIFSLRDNEATARAYGTTLKMFKNMAHDMMLEKEWQQVADHIMEII